MTGLKTTVTAPNWAVEGIKEYFQDQPIYWPLNTEEDHLAKVLTKDEVNKMSLEEKADWYSKSRQGLLDLETLLGYGLKAASDPDFLKSFQDDLGSNLILVGLFNEEINNAISVLRTNIPLLKSGLSTPVQSQTVAKAVAYKPNRTTC